eukprot:9503464-Pyramimonas_sp.AAC.2
MRTRTRMRSARRSHEDKDADGGTRATVELDTAGLFFQQGAQSANLTGKSSTMISGGISPSIASNCSTVGSGTYSTWLSLSGCPTPSRMYFKTNATACHGFGHLARFVHLKHLLCPSHLHWAHARRLPFWWLKPPNLTASGSPPTSNQKAMGPSSIGNAAAAGTAAAGTTAASAAPAAAPPPAPTGGAGCTGWPPASGASGSYSRATTSAPSPWNSRSSNAFQTASLELATSAMAFRGAGFFRRSKHM